MSVYKYFNFAIRTSNFVGHKICCRTGTCELIFFVSDAADGTRSKIICEPPREERDCTMPACPIDCVFNDWADWWGISVLTVSHLPKNCRKVSSNLPNGSVL